MGRPETVHPVLWTVVCPVRSVTLVYCGQTVGWIKMKLAVDIGLSAGHVVLDGLPKRGTAANFRPMFVVAKWLEWIKMPLGTEVSLGPAHIVLDVELGTLWKGAL